MNKDSIGDRLPHGEASPERRALVEQARSEWIRRLIDFSRRNNLLFFRDLKTGTLDLSGANLEGMEKVLAGQAVVLTDLLPDADPTRTAARAQEIRRRALSNLEERGLETLFVALGMATWKPADEGRPPESAVLLVPVRIEARGREGKTLALQRAGEVQTNLALLQFLSEYGCTVAPEQLLEETQDEDQPLDTERVFARLREAAHQVPEFTIKPRAMLGNFSFQKMAMVKDLRERTAELESHDIIGAIAGDRGARESLTRERSDVEPRELDKVRPENEFLILDADSSQQRVAAAVFSGQDGVIQGPPGTGKSQTIANLIAGLAAQEKRVLFVAEKRAALDVVQRRLQAAGLGHLALDLHGADVSRKQVMQRVKQALAAVRESTPVDAAELHEAFVERRNRLNEHVARLHVSRLPSGCSLYDLQGRLLRLVDTVRPSTRFRGDVLDGLTAQRAASARDLLLEAGGFASLFLRIDSSPWTGAVLPDGAALQHAMDLVRRLLATTFPQVQSLLARMTSATGLTSPPTIESSCAAASVVEDVGNLLIQYREQFFHEDLTQIRESLAPASRGILARAWARCANGAYRKTLQRLRQLRRGGKGRPQQMQSDVVAGINQLERWRKLSHPAAAPVAFAEVSELVRALAQLLEDIQSLSSILGRANLAALPFDAIEDLLIALDTDSTVPHRIPRLCEIEAALRDSGLDGFVHELQSKKPPADLWLNMFEYAWLASCLDKARIEDSAIAGFNGRAHERFVEGFCRLDRERLGIAIQRVRRAHGEAAIAAMNLHRDQADLVTTEAQKKSRHLPLRKLLARAPDVLTAVFPCWMASPLSVSQLLDADRRYFDVVIFDEASQVLPEDAVCAFLRASRAVVAGDQRQLPPTTFFAAGEDEDEEVDEGDRTSGFESVLDVMASFLPPWSLDWHYRSRDEALIAFSNRHIYDDRLVTFPSPGGAPSVSHILVPHAGARDGEEESASPEVLRVVELVLEHAEKRPDESLGVIAMGLPHARRVEAAIDRARMARPDLDSFFDEGLMERFFVKNLERVQGDERDAVILTVGYGKDRTGRLLYRFGPLNANGGERRLNVAITRARCRMTVVSSFDHHDMDPSRLRSGSGAELLRLYLEYAASNGAKLGDVGETGMPVNPFEADVADALSAKGMSLSAQWGASRYRIDLVARHPKRPGRFVLAIECDGATYHSAYTARDRDRLRQQHLEALGWRFHRIWSTDWFMRREEEIARAVKAFEAAVQQADEEDGGGGAQQPRSPTPAAPSVGVVPNGAQRRVQRDPRPNVPTRASIGEYSRQDLVQLVQWIRSDGLLRTDDDILREVVRELGFQRCGVRIESAIRAAIAVST